MNRTDKGSNESSERPGAGSAAGIFDYATSVSHVDGEAELLDEIIAAFLAQEPVLLGNLNEAVIARDAMSVRKAAHALSSTVSVLCADRAGSAARRVEAIGFGGDLSALEPEFRVLQEEFRLLHDALQAIMRSRQRAA